MKDREQKMLSGLTPKELQEAVDKIISQDKKPTPQPRKRRFKKIFKKFLKLLKEEAIRAVIQKIVKLLGHLILMALTLFFNAVILNLIGTLF